MLLVRFIIVCADASFASIQLHSNIVLVCEPLSWKSHIVYTCFKT